MANSSSDVMAKLQALRDSFAAQLPDKIQEIEAVGETLCGGKCSETEEDEALKLIHYLSHKLTGSGATFGFGAVSDAARTLETFVNGMLDHATRPTTAQRAQIRGYLEGLQQAAGKHDHKDGANAGQESAIPMPRVPENNGEHRLIYLVDDDPLLAQDLALQLGNFNYTTRIFHSLAEFRKAVRQAMPAALIMDMGLPDGNGANAIMEIQEGRAAPLPVVFLSGRGDMEARLAGVRAGGAGYFTKPVDIGAMVDALDALTAQKAPAPYRILIVDDTPSLARYFALTLRGAGMITEVVTDPMDIMRALVEFAPELILLDMYMPGCNGLELAMVIRQQEAYVGIPIVFLSAETDLNKQLEAMRQGGDDFLVKPIQPDHLISAVANRARRYHILRSFMTRDSLTGLYNHTTTKELLNNAAGLAQRRNTPLAFAMIDIDHFKSVNDTYGHATGDRVIKSLSRLLQQRLRKTDIIGRYGGEEFAVALIDADATRAASIMNEIRVSFEQIRHRVDGREFNVTFSCGMAVFPPNGNAAEFNEAADKALYEAKRSGRNKVVVADSTMLSGN